MACGAVALTAGTVFAGPPRAETGNMLVFVGDFEFDGTFNGGGTSLASLSCNAEAQGAGLPPNARFIAWLSDSTGDVRARIPNPQAGPIWAANGTLIAYNVADLANCTKGPGDRFCLLGMIDRDVNGREVKPGTQTWTGTLPDGTADTPNCNNWTSKSASDEGSGGLTLAIDAGWTTGFQHPCNQFHHLICLQIE